MARNSEVLERVRREVPVPSRAFERLVRRRARKARNGRIAAGVVALVVTSVAIGGAFLVFRRSTIVGPPTPADGGAAPKLVAGPGEYYYAKTLRYVRGEGDLLGPWTHEIWHAPDGSGRIIFTPDHNEDTSASVGSLTPGDGPADKSYRPGEFPLEDVPELSTDPTVLLRQLSDRGAPTGASPNPVATTSPGRSQEDTSLLRTLSDLFDGDEQFTTPEQRVAMFEVAKAVDGVEFVQRTTDPVGRSAMSLRWIVQYGGPPSTVEWFFDSESKQLMASTWTEDGVVLQAHVVALAGIVDSMDRRPIGAALFFPSAQKERFSPVGGS
jgi:hypothetical protein